MPQASAGCYLGIGNCDDNERIPYCKEGDSCSIEKGTDIVKGNIQDIETKRGFVDYIQDIVGYLLGFLVLI